MWLRLLISELTRFSLSLRQDRGWLRKIQAGDRLSAQLSSITLQYLNIVYFSNSFHKAACIFLKLHVCRIFKTSSVISVFIALEFAFVLSLFLFKYSFISEKEVLPSEDMAQTYLVITFLYWKTVFFQVSTTFQNTSIKLLYKWSKLSMKCCKTKISPSGVDQTICEDIIFLSAVFLPSKFTEFKKIIHLSGDISHRYDSNSKC